MAKPRPAAQSKPLLIKGLTVPLELRESPRARRLTLRVDPVRGTIQVVVPHGLQESDITGFVARHLPWVESRLAALPPRLPFEDGAEVPLLGRPHRIRHMPGHRGTECRDGEIRVGGAIAHIARRTRDFLTTQARCELTVRSHYKAAELGVRIARVSVRDTKSRWGSCAQNGRLSYSWRLVLAPEPVLDYVVAHEVAHLVEMNHSPRFWAVVARLSPHGDQPRAWLKTNGARLLRYG